MSNRPASKFHRIARPTALCATLAGAAALLGTAFAATQPEGTEKSAADGTPEVKIEHEPVNRSQAPFGSFAPIVQKVAPSVVEVFVTSRTQMPDQMSADGSDLFQRFFGQRRGGPGQQGGDSFAPRQHGLGSGVIVSKDGYILTNNHVVDKATEIRVALSDGREFPAKLIGADAKTDVAVVKITADNLPALPFADTKELAVGDVVLAVGNPFGIGQTVTQGIVSAKDRITSGDMDEDFIQTDAAINPGNSGGALVDTQARLVGINTAILSHSGGNQGIGFAIPSDICQWVLTSLVKSGHVERGFMGVSIQSLTPVLAQEFKLDRITGALVADVSPGGPADHAGLKSGDVIEQFNGQAVRDSAQLKLLVAETVPGTKVPLQVMRDGQAQSFDLTLNDQPGQKVARSSDKSGSNGHHEALSGVAVTDLNGNVRGEANVPENVHGALVSEVAQDSPAFEAGLREGNVILEINHKQIKNAQDAVDETTNPTSNQTLVKVWSREGTRYLTVDEDNAG